VDAVQQTLVQRVVQGRVGLGVRLADAEHRRHGGEAHQGGPRGGQRAQRLGQPGRAHQVDGEHGSPVVHGGRDARGMGHRPQGAPLGAADRQARQGVAVGHVGHHRLDRDAGPRQLGRGGGHARLVPIHQQHHVHQVQQPPGAGQAHAPRRPGGDADRGHPPRPPATSSSPR
jgi:hypothetical protein